MKEGRTRSSVMELAAIFALAIGSPIMPPCRYGRDGLERLLAISACSIWLDPAAWRLARISHTGSAI
jgi:hypothetical protein